MKFLSILLRLLMKTATPGRVHCPLYPFCHDGLRSGAGHPASGAPPVVSAEGAGTSLSHKALLHVVSEFLGGRWLVAAWSCEGRVPEGPRARGSPGPLSGQMWLRLLPACPALPVQAGAWVPSPGWLWLGSPGDGGPVLCPGLWARLHEDTGVHSEALGGAWV